MRIRFRRWRLLAALSLAVPATVAVLVVLWPRKGGWTEADFGRIQVGMSRAEVETILGTPWDAHPVKGQVKDGRWHPRPAVLEPLKDDRDYDWAIWQRFELFRTPVANVIFDGDRVACRYSHALSGGLWARWWGRIRSFF
jgi:hypothetical protein